MAEQSYLSVIRARRHLLCTTAGVLAIFALWQLLSVVMHDVIIASPWDTIHALFDLARSGTLWIQLLITLRRLVVSLLIGSSIGLSLGLLAGISSGMHSFLEPIRWVTMTLPAIVIAVLGMLWFGMGGRQAIFLVSFIVAPIVYINTVNGVLGIDTQLLEMGRTYRFSRRLFLSQVYLPGIALPIASGLTLAAGIGVRGIILAELLGAFDGVGHGFSRAWTHLNTPELFAWVVSALALMAVLEFGFLKPVRRHLGRWKAKGTL